MRARDNDRELFERLADGDREARNELFRRHRPLALQLARSFRGADRLDDLAQVAAIGLLMAIDRFDPGRGFRFASFAVPTIRGELMRYLRDITWALRVPRDLHDVALGAQRVRRDLETTLGRVPTASEVASKMGVTIETVVAALQASATRRTRSLDAPSPNDDDIAPGLVDALAEDDVRLARAEDRAFLRPLLRRLSQRDREILRMRFEEDLTQKAIGERLGVSQMHVSRLLRSALRKLSVAAHTG